MSKHRFKELQLNKKIHDLDRNVERYFTDLRNLNFIQKPEESMSPEELVIANLPFAAAVAKQYINMGLPLDDLIQESNWGLINASKTFDASKGFKFISYAVFHCREKCISALKGRNIVHIPQSLCNKYNFPKIINDFAQKNDRFPSIEEVSELIGEHKYIKALPLDMTSGYFNNHENFENFENTDFSIKNDNMMDDGKIYDILKPFLAQLDIQYLREYLEGGEDYHHELSKKYGIQKKSTSSKFRKIIQKINKPEIKKILSDEYQD